MTTSPTPTSQTTPFFDGKTIAFIGGGNMASAMIGGLLRLGMPHAQIQVIEPFEAARAKLSQQWQIQAFDKAGPFLRDAAVVVWATKPQVLREAAGQTLEYLSTQALHLSIAAGVTTLTLQRWLKTEAIVRAMPNTPALIGQGMTGLFALPSVQAHQKAWIDQLVATLGLAVWVNDENAIDAITALSGSGPAYVFMFAKAMVDAGAKMGLNESVARDLVLATFAGATALASQSPESLETLMAQVTSKGGTTYAALTTMQSLGVASAIEQGAIAAQLRAVSLGQEMDQA